MSEDIMQALSDLRAAFQKHCEWGAEKNAVFETTLVQLSRDVSMLSKVVTRGSNGKSLSERVDHLEWLIGGVQRDVRRLVAKSEKRLKLTLAFWGPVACSIIASATALLVAFIK